VIPAVQNWFQARPGEGETFEQVVNGRGFRLERIISRGAATGEWYDQALPEWVLLAAGQAELEFEEGCLQLVAGDALLIPAHCRHRVRFTSRDAVWVALHFEA